MSYTIELEPVCIEVGTVKVKGKAELTLRRFQEETIGFFSSPRQYLFLTAPTGSGKTFTLLAPLFANAMYGTQYDGALGIYPTKPLAVDQFESLKSTLSKLSSDVRIVAGDGLAVYDLEFDLERDGSHLGHYRSRVGLVLLTRDNVEKLKEALSVESGRNVLDAIRRNLLAESVDYLVTLAVPEYPYLMMSYMYRSHHDLAKLLDVVASGDFVRQLATEMLSLMREEDRLGRLVERTVRMVNSLIESRVAERELADLMSALLPPVIFFDEFHTWGFYELPTAIALVLLHRLVSLTSTRREMYRVVFSSATPNKFVMDMLEKLAGRHAIMDVRADVADCGKPGSSRIRGKTTVELYTIRSKLSNYLAWIKMDKHLPSVVESKLAEILASKRAIVFGRRVYSVEEAARRFHEKTGVVPVIVTGFTPPPGFLGREELVVKKSNGELYVFGNYAVELGVDLQNVTYSVISAASLGELLQRMGRSGRGGVDSKVVILTPSTYAENLVNRLCGKTRVSYSEFADALSWVLVDESIIRKLGNRLIAKSRVGLLRLYLPLATYVLVSVVRHKDKPRDLGPVLVEFKKVLDVAGVKGGFFRWLTRRVSKHPRALVELAAFRISPSVPYVRKGSSNRVDGEANPITILSNYDVEIDSTGGFRLIIKKPRRAVIGKMASIHISVPDNLLESLDRAVLPSGLLLQLVKPARNTLAKILRRLDAPVYVVYTGGKSILVLDVLHTYGQAVVLKHSGEVYAYLLLL